MVGAADARALAVLPQPDPEHPLTLEDRPHSTVAQLTDVATGHPQHEPLRLTVGALRTQ
ncbi:hypothetical protein ACWET9_47895 [Streptomyces sp. NPDC004059]